MQLSYFYILMLFGSIFGEFAQTVIVRQKDVSISIRETTRQTLNTLIQIENASQIGIISPL